MAKCRNSSTPPPEEPVWDGEEIDDSSNPLAESLWPDDDNISDEPAPLEPVRFYMGDMRDIRDILFISTFIRLFLSTAGHFRVGLLLGQAVGCMENMPDSALPIPNLQGDIVTLLGYIHHSFDPSQDSEKPGYSMSIGRDQFGYFTLWVVAHQQPNRTRWQLTVRIADMIGASYFVDIDTYVFIWGTVHNSE